MADKKTKKPKKPGREQAEEAVRTLLLWAGEDPDRGKIGRVRGRSIRTLYRHPILTKFQNPIELFFNEHFRATY